MPWVMMVLSSATTGHRAASASATGGWMSMRGRAVSGVMSVLQSGEKTLRQDDLVALCHLPCLRHKGKRLAETGGREGRHRLGALDGEHCRGSAFAQCCPQRQASQQRGNRGPGQGVAGAGYVGDPSRRGRV